MTGLFVWGDMMTEGITGTISKLRQILRKEREKKRLTQAQVAKRMGLTRAHLSLLESGERKLYVQLLIDWCGKGLRLSPQKILEKWMRSFPVNGGKRPRRKKPAPEQKCIECKTNEMKLFAKILCDNCYNSYMAKTNKKYAKVPGIGGWLVQRPPWERRASDEVQIKQYLLEEYVAKNRSIAEIARNCHCSHSTIRNKLTSYNIQLRDRTHEREIKYNEKFFTSWSPQMAYVLGIIYTDGCLYPGRSKNPSSKIDVSYCSISQADPELLTKVLALMNSKARIYFAQQKQNGETVGGIYRIHIYSEKIYDDLISLGLTPRKSQTMKFPELPPEYMRHFIRGCWDGDGSVFLYDGKLGASFISGSLDFIEQLVQKLYKVGVHKELGDPITIHKRKGACQIKVHSRESLENLFHYLYDGVDESLYLKRKYETFLQGLAPKPIASEKTSTKSTKKELSEKEFTARAIKKLRKKPYEGIHTVYSGFNDAWRNYFGTDPIEGVQKLAQQGKIEIRPAKKGGAIIYVPGEGPGLKNVLDIILE